MGNYRYYRFILEVKERLIITKNNVGLRPDTPADIENNRTQCMHCATCVKTLVINMTGLQASSRKWTMKNSYIVTRWRSTWTSLALEHGGVTSGNRGKYDKMLYDSQYQYNKYSTIQPITMGCHTNRILRCDCWQMTLFRVIAARCSNNIIVALPMTIVIWLLAMMLIIM